MKPAPFDCLVNGSPARQVPVDDRGLRYADGLFRTILVINSQVVDIKRHIRHLNDGCERLGIRPPTALTLDYEMRWLADGMSRGLLRYTVTRGPGPRGYAPPADATPTRICERLPLGPRQEPADGACVRWCQARVSVNPALAGIKTLNRLEQVLACAEWSNPDIHEGLMLDTENHVVGGTKTNLFIVSSGKLVTPRLDRSGVRGVQREIVLETAERLGIAVECANLSAEQVNQADELFLTNSIIGIWPVRQLESRHYAPGPVTSRLQQETSKRLSEYN